MREHPNPGERLRAEFNQQRKRKALKTTNEQGLQTETIRGTQPKKQKNKTKNQADSRRINERLKCGSVKTQRTEGPDCSGPLQRIVDSDPVLYCALYSNLDEGTAKVKYV